MNPEKYISAAKSHFQILLLSIGVSIYISISYYRDFKLLDSARNDLAEWLYYDVLQKEYSGIKGFDKDSSYKYVPNYPLYENSFDLIGGTWFYKNKLDISIFVNKPEDKEIESVIGKYHNQYYWTRTIRPKYQKLLLNTNYQSEERQWLKTSLDFFNSIVEPIDSLSDTNPEEYEKEMKGVDPSWFTNDPLQQNFRIEQYIKELHIKYLAESYNVQFTKTDTITDVYHAIETQYYNDSFVVPVIDLSFSAIGASWIITFIHLLLSISLMNKLYIVERFGKEDDLEPWSIFDAFNRFSSILSSIIISLISLLPLVSIGNLLFIFYFTNKIDGFTHNNFYYIIYSFIFLSLLAILGFTTVKTVSYALKIRRKRALFFKKLHRQ